MSNNFNRKNCLKLYRALLERQISYNEKEEHFSWIKDYLAKKISPRTFRGKFLKMQKQDDDTTQILKEGFEQLSNFSIDLKLEEGPFSLLIALAYDNSMLTVEFGPEDGIFEEEFRASIGNIFSNSKIFQWSMILKYITPQIFEFEKW